ncbi:uncharacterized protein MONOS_973 [Monocercomonoides exilis]|uniref:uncharacterized protein n=1 Tax=Monocercomonoides exilis TaxID=2049356 RepID=UPI00355A5A85|nr:hypothetical protein MONOS_973 [Monocercomonoides exilis]|eukprot:MONOS_973.1-p1 / transcript=MONOS_973.1 / gene=MONOS_973 / organism=Monocercomonoides_exilis_PA203 / gene_product=unspecified product / transcript_product=unspecified product / location=Mono_scaffold00016:114598-116857(-) / protein_length=728 / sequence_SO=supercontig / SO=protein_coding / is_pseudo=false
MDIRPIGHVQLDNSPVVLPPIFYPPERYNGKDKIRTHPKHNIHSLQSFKKKNTLYSIDEELTISELDSEVKTAAHVSEEIMKQLNKEDNSKIADTKNEEIERSDSPDLLETFTEHEHNFTALLEEVTNLLSWQEQDPQQDIISKFKLLASKVDDKTHSEDSEQKEEGKAEGEDKPQNLQDSDLMKNEKSVNLSEIRKLARDRMKERRLRLEALTNPVEKKGAKNKLTWREKEEIFEKENGGMPHFMIPKGVSDGFGDRKPWNVEKEIRKKQEELKEEEEEREKQWRRMWKREREKEKRKMYEEKLRAKEQNNQTDDKNKNEIQTKEHGEEEAVPNASSFSSLSNQQTDESEQYEDDFETVGESKSSTKNPQQTQPGFEQRSNQQQPHFQHLAAIPSLKLSSTDLSPPINASSFASPPLPLLSSKVPRIPLKIAVPLSMSVTSISSPAMLSARGEPHVRSREEEKLAKEKEEKEEKEWQETIQTGTPLDVMEKLVMFKRKDEKKQRNGLSPINDHYLITPRFQLPSSSRAHLSPGFSSSASASASSLSLHTRSNSSLSRTAAPAVTYTRSNSSNSSFPSTEKKKYFSESLQIRREGGNGSKMVKSPLSKSSVCSDCLLPSSPASLSDSSFRGFRSRTSLNEHQPLLSHSLTSQSAQAKDLPNSYSSSHFSPSHLADSPALNRHSSSLSSSAHRLYNIRSTSSLDRSSYSLSPPVHAQNPSSCTKHSNK